MDNQTFKSLMKEASMSYLDKSIEPEDKRRTAHFGFGRIWNRYSGGGASYRRSFVSRPAFKVIAACAAAILIVFLVGLIGVRSSADWDDTAFGYIRRLINSNLAIDEFTATENEISSFSVEKVGFSLNGDEYSIEPTLNEFLIHGWKIDRIGSYAIDVKMAGQGEYSINFVNITFADSFFMSNGDQQIQVYLNWSDLISNKKTKDCKIDSVAIGKNEGLVVNGFDIKRMTASEYEESFIYYNQRIDMYTGDILNTYYPGGDVNMTVSVSPFNVDEYCVLNFAESIYPEFETIDEIFDDGELEEDHSVQCISEYEGSTRYDSFPLSAFFFGKDPEVGDGVVIREMNLEYDCCYQARAINRDLFDKFITGSISTHIISDENDKHFPMDSGTEDDLIDRIEEQRQAFRSAEEADKPRIIAWQEYTKRHKEFWNSIDLGEAESIFVVNPNYADRITESIIERECRYIWDVPLKSKLLVFNEYDGYLFQGYVFEDVDHSIWSASSGPCWSPKYLTCEMWTFEFPETPLPVLDGYYTDDYERNEYLVSVFEEDHFEFGKELVLAAADKFIGHETRDISYSYLGFACTPIYINADGDPDDPQRCVMPYTLEEGIPFEEGDPDSVVLIYTFIYEIARPVQW